jgi:S-DNA-T family DNA segregation ATPase FtsK/SpoIIIE
MHSTRHPPFSPPLPKETEEEQGGSRVVRLHRNPADPARASAPDSGEPAWRQAFVRGDGVIATRTPDRVIRARNGHPEPTPVAKVVRSAAPATCDELPPSRPESGEAQTKSALRHQVDHLRDAFGSDTPDFSQKLSSLTRKEAALADSSGRDIEVSDNPLRLTIERVLRIPQVGSDQAEMQSAAADGLPAREDSPPTGMTLSLQGPAVSFSWSHPTYFGSEDRQAGLTEHALRSPESPLAHAAPDLPVRAATTQPVSDSTAGPGQRAFTSSGCH